MPDRPGRLARELFEACGRGDPSTVGSTLADLVAYVTS
jgi:hypothetical protein